MFFGGLLVLSVLLAIRDVINLLALSHVEWLFVLAGIGLGIFVGVIPFFTDSIDSHPAIVFPVVLLGILLFVSMLFWKPVAHIGLPILLALLSVAHFRSRASRVG